MEEYTHKCEDRILKGVEHIRKCSANLVIVTNEVFSDTLSYDETTLAYIRLLGHINAEFAQMADEVVEVVYGIPLSVKNPHKTEEGAI